MCFVRVFAAAATVCAVVPAGCSDRSKGVFSVPLITRATEPSAVEPLMVPGGGSVGSIEVYVEPVRDERTDSGCVGENLEEERPVVITWSGTTPADFVRAAIERGTLRMGVHVTPDPAGATHVVRARLMQFFTIERSTYVAEVSAVVSISKPGSSTPLWEGPATGRAERFGLSLNAEHYQEVLTDATQRMVAAALNSPGVREALVK